VRSLDKREFHSRLLAEGRSVEGEGPQIASLEFAFSECFCLHRGYDALGTRVINMRTKDGIGEPGCMNLVYWED